MTGDPEPDFSGRGSQRRRLALVSLLIGGFFLVEVVAALRSGSLALLSDAGHMLVDLGGLLLALAAMTVAMHTAQAKHRTYGRYRLEMLAALVNGVLLVGVGGYAIVEGVRRLFEPEPVASGVMVVVAAAGLVVNVIGWLVLHRSVRGSLNMEAALLEVGADLLGSVAALTAGLLIRYAGWAEADAVFGILLGLVVVPRAVVLALKASRVLMQHSPSRISPDEVERALLAVESVESVHDLHLWSLTSGMDVATVHVLVEDDANLHEVLDGARRVIEEDFEVQHATVQVEPGSHSRCVEAGW